MAQKYTLNWQTFTDHLQLMFKDLYEDGKHSDVTLVCDDQTQFKAHKIVLGACSPVFKKIIDNNLTQHPLIYLRGIQSYEMESILQFMYLGEGKFCYERMGEFMKVAKDLEVKDISKGVELPNKEEDVTEESVMGTEEKDTIEDIIPKQTPEKISQRQPRNKISSNIMSIVCPECGKGFTRDDILLAHFRYTHEGIKYPCNQCDYQATTQSSLQQHIKSKHEGIKYPCNHCDYLATRQDSLTVHIGAKHSGRILKCEHCDYQCKWRSDLYKHKRTTHAKKV